jgi:hypothetical protein
MRLECNKKPPALLGKGEDETGERPCGVYAAATV